MIIIPLPILIATLPPILQLLPEQTAIIILNRPHSSLIIQKKIADPIVQTPDLLQPNFLNILLQLLTFIYILLSKLNNRVHDILIINSNQLKYVFQLLISKYVVVLLVIVFYRFYRLQNQRF